MLFSAALLFQNLESDLSKLSQSILILLAATAAACGAADQSSHELDADSAKTEHSSATMEQLKSAAKDVPLNEEASMTILRLEKASAPATGPVHGDYDDEVVNEIKFGFQVGSLGYFLTFRLQAGNEVFIGRCKAKGDKEKQSVELFTCHYRNQAGDIVSPSFMTQLFGLKNPNTFSLAIK